jgi:hypothetical protein
VTIEPPAGWGPTRQLVTELKALGYEIDEYRVGGETLLAPRSAVRPPAPS